METVGGFAGFVQLSGSCSTFVGQNGWLTMGLQALCDCMGLASTFIGQNGWLMMGLQALCDCMGLAPLSLVSMGD